MEQVVITDIKVLNPKGFFLEPIRLSFNFNVEKPLQKGEKMVKDRFRMESHLCGVGGKL